MPKLGTVLLLDGLDNHFWIIIGKEIGGLVLAVNVTDRKNNPNSPCHINIGDHPDIKKPSVIYYKKAREFEAEKVDAQIISDTDVHKRTDCTPELLARIVAGAKEAATEEKGEMKKRFLDYLA